MLNILKKNLRKKQDEYMFVYVVTSSPLVLSIDFLVGSNV